LGRRPQAALVVAVAAMRGLATSMGLVVRQQVLVARVARVELAVRA
jgi:hypothetical protein